MALMNTLRNKMGKVVVAAITLAILSFVLTDLLGGQNSVFLGGNDTSVGEIAGEKVEVQEYQLVVDRLIDNYRNNFGRSPGNTELSSLREQAWQLMIVEKAFEKEYESAGIQVGAEELVDMVQGKNIAPDIRQIFTNPQTGQFDRDRLIGTLNQMSQTPQGRAQWNLFEQSLIPARERLKLDNIMIKSSTANNQEAVREYNDQTAVAEAKYVYVPFYAVSDSAVSVSDGELKAYLNSHKEDYKTEWSKSIQYVSFPIQASPEDSIAYRDDLRNIIEQFRADKNDSLYARANSDTEDYYATYNLGNLPILLKSNLNILKEGDVIGPYLDNDSYALYKISSVQNDTVGYARASHILIKWDDDSDEAKAKSRTEANDVLGQLKAGADFAEMAKEYSTDGGTAINGGDLGWFDSNTMVAEFGDPVFSSTKTGLIPRLVETQFGYHIIDVTELPTYTKYKIASVKRIIDASDETRDAAFRIADFFAGTSGNQSEFEVNATTEALIIMEEDDIKQNDLNINRVGYARQVVTWLFNEGSVGKVSDVFELDNEYLVAVMTAEVEEGTADLETVRLEVTSKVKNEKKGKVISDKLAGMTGTVDEIAAAYGADASVYSSSSILLSANSLPSVGIAPEAIGTIFAKQGGEMTGPVHTDNGVVVIEVLSVTGAPEIADHSTYLTSIEQGRENRASFYLGELIKEKAEIKDTRYKFY
jgi:peptidyl-prolyl cis-trans isomerase D